jgi:hypothetical protein
MPQYENPLAQDKPRTYATRHRDIDGEMEVYGHELDGRPAWIRVGGLGHAAVEIKP